MNGSIRSLSHSGDIGDQTISFLRYQALLVVLQNQPFSLDVFHLLKLYKKIAPHLSSGVTANLRLLTYSWMRRSFTARRFLELPKLAQHIEIPDVG